MQINIRTITAKRTGRRLLEALVFSLPFTLSAGYAFTQTTVCSGVPTTITSLALTTPYPNTLTVTNPMVTSIGSVYVTLNGLTHTFPSDLEMLVTGPGGQKLVIVGGVGAGADLAAVNLVIRDDTAVNYPELPGAQIVAGTYNPTDLIGGHDFTIGTPPGPPGPYGIPQPNGTATFASVFNGTNPNGTWSLYILDNVLQDEGTLTDWCVTYSPPAAAAVVSVSGRLATTGGQGVRGARVSLTDSAGSTRTATTGSFGYYRFDDVETGQTVVVSVVSKHFTFANPMLVLSVNDDLSGVDFVATAE